jgi:hypothetical protein
MGCISKLLWQKYRNIIGALYGKGLLSVVYHYSHQEFSACFIYIHHIYRAAPWLRWLVGGLSPQSPGFNPRPVCVGFLMDRLTLVQVLQVSFSPSAPYSFVHQQSSYVIFVISSSV